MFAPFICPSQGLLIAVTSFVALPLNFTWHVAASQAQTESHDTISENALRQQLQVEKNRLDSLHFDVNNANVNVCNQINNIQTLTM